jgi:hypothetical protein
VKMLLMQQGLWKHIDTESGESRSDTSKGSGSGTSKESGLGTSEGSLIPAPSAINIAKERVIAGRLIISTLSDSIILNVIHLVDPKQIWNRLNGKYNVQSSSRCLALKEKLYSLRLGEGNSIDSHLQEVNLLVHQLAGQGFAVADEDLVDLILTNLPKSWATFRQIHKHSLPSFPVLEGLLLQEEVTCELENAKK